MRALLLLKQGIGLVSKLHQSRAMTLHVRRVHVNFLCTQASPVFPEESSETREETKCLSYRIEKLSRGEPVGSACQSWMADGFPIHRGDVYHAINRLRKHKLNKRALEVIVYFIHHLFLCCGHIFLSTLKLKYAEHVK